MAVHYEVLAGQTLIIAGPANVTVKGGEVPVIGDVADIADSVPVIASLDPDSAESGSADITMVINGDGFTENSVIVFGQHDEPTTFDAAAGTVSTGVKPSLFAPATVPVAVRNGPARSDPVDFTFTDPGAGTTRKRKA